MTASSRFPGILGTALSATLLLIAGCRDARPAVAILPRTTATPLWEPLHQGIVEVARPAGVSVYWNAPSSEADVEGQMRMYAALQTKGYRGFILSPDETLAARTAVLETVHRGIPVVIVNDELGPPASPGLSYVRSDESVGATLAVQELVHLLHGHGTVAITGIIPRSEISLSREENLERALAGAAPGIRIIDRRFGDTVTTHQQQIAREIMDRADGVDAIIALSATSSMGAYYARLAAPLPRPLAVIGFDQVSLLPLKTAGIDAIVAEDTRTIGQIAMRNLDAEMRGQPVEGTTLVPPLLLTRDSFRTPALDRLLAYTSFDWKDATTPREQIGGSR